MDVIGIIKKIGFTEKVSESFQKRDLVITDNSSSKYPQHLSFQLTQTRCDVLDGFGLGDEVRVHFNLRGREWQSPAGEIKYFNQLEAWKIEKLAAAAPAAESVAYVAPAANPEQESDLPF